MIFPGNPYNETTRCSLTMRQIWYLKTNCLFFENVFLLYNDFTLMFFLFISRNNFLCNRIIAPNFKFNISLKIDDWTIMVLCLKLFFEVLIFFSVMTQKQKSRYSKNASNYLKYPYIIGMIKTNTNEIETNISRFTEL